MRQATEHNFPFNGEKSFFAFDKIRRGVLKNYFQGLKIYFQGLVIYFQGLIIYFQALKIILLSGRIENFEKEKSHKRKDFISILNMIMRGRAQSVCLRDMGSFAI